MARTRVAGTADLASEGVLGGECIECPVHQALFDVKSGAAAAGPAAAPLETCPCGTEGGDVRVDVDGGSRACRTVRSCLQEDGHRHREDAERSAADDAIPTSSCGPWIASAAARPRDDACLCFFPRRECVNSNGTRSRASSGRLESPT